MENKRNGLITATKVLGIILAVCYGITAVILFLVSIGMLFYGIPSMKVIFTLLALSAITVFVLSILGVIFTSKANTYCNKEYCTQAAVIFTVLSCVTPSILSILCAVFLFKSRKMLNESGLPIKKTVVTTSVVGGILGLPMLVVYLGMLIYTIMGDFPESSSSVPNNNSNYEVSQKQDLDDINDTEEYISNTTDKINNSTDSWGEAGDSLDSIGNTGQEIDTTERAEQSQQPVSKDVPTEYKNALRSAKLYSEMLHLSKRGLYEQLTSEYGDKFSAEAAQYAVDNLDIDFKQNALKSAQTYSSMLGLSKQGIYDQLVSEFGDKFTAEEAQYAIDNLQ